MKKNKFILAMIAMLFIVSFIIVLYLIYGHKIILTMYLGKSFGILNDFLVKEAHPLQYYFDRIDGIVFGIFYYVLLLFLSLSLYIAIPGKIFNKIYDFLLRIDHFFLKNKRICLSLFFVISILVLIIFSLVVLQDFPNSADEYACLFQAKYLASGKLWVHPHQLHKFFQFNHIYSNHGKLFSLFYPGWPLILSIGVFLRCPGLVNPLISSLSLIIIFLIGRKLSVKFLAVIPIFILSLTPFFLITSSSYFSHPTCMLFLLLSVYFLLIAASKESKIFSFFASFCLGWAFITRPYTVFLFILVFIIYLFSKHGRIYLKLLFPHFIIGFSIFAIIFLLYNYLFTNNPFRSNELFFSNYYFFGKGYTLGMASRDFILQLVDYSFWTSPYFSLIYVYYFFGVLIRKRDMSLWLFAAPLIFLAIGHIFLGQSGGNRYGPRFYYEATPFMIIFIVSCIFNVKSYLKKTSLEKYMFFLLICSLFFNVPLICYNAIREHKAIIERQDVFKLVKKENIHNSIIFLKTGTGTIRRMSRGDLVRNSPDFSDDVLYALDLGKENIELINFYPKKNYYIYTYNNILNHEKLEKIKK